MMESNSQAFITKYISNEKIPAEWEGVYKVLL